MHLKNLSSAFFNKNLLQCPMILNTSKIKTEAILLFCKDLILAYKSEQENSFDINSNVDKEMIKISDEMLKQINVVTRNQKYYLENRAHYRIKAILNSYNYINKQISNELKKDSKFNPSMLYFALLSTWFKELDKESRSKEYIYFLIYPYTKVYDQLLVNIKDEEFKKLNILMIEIAERVIFKLDKISIQ